MKKPRLLLITVLLAGTIACKHEIYDDDECIACESCEAPIGYVDYEVDFYTTHKDFVVKPAVYDTVIQELLATEAHREGAVFQTITEQLLVLVGYRTYRISRSYPMQFVIDAEKDSIAEMDYHVFYEGDEIYEVQVPSEFVTKTRKVVIQDGTGAPVPATYTTLVRYLVVSDAELLPNEAEQEYVRKTFRIPANVGIRDYLEQQFAQQGIEDCVEGNSYGIVE